MLQAVILAGGLGTRLRGVVPDQPKAMALVAGRPFLEIQLRELAKKGFADIVLSVGYLAEKIESHFGGSFAGMRIRYAREDRPLGTGGALRLALTCCNENHVFVFNGDTFVDLEVSAIERHWQFFERPIIVGKEVPDTFRYGRLLLSEEGSHVVGFTEKGTSGPGVINVGCYVVLPNQLDGFAPERPFSFEKDYLTNAVQRTVFDFFETKGQFIDIGIPEDYDRAQSQLACLV